jgi:hypothetical protein
MVAAGWHARASEAGGLGAGLEVMKEHAFGVPALALVGFGLMAFGLFAFVEARYRVIRAADVVEG